MYEVTKIFSFDAAHRILDYVGKCGVNHGHRFVVEVTLRRNYLENDMLVDFSVLKKVVNNKIINRLDHTTLNNIVNFNPTAENLAKYIYDELKPCFPEIFSVKVWETPTSYAKYYE